jgi:hypothetical protein
MRIVQAVLPRLAGAHSTRAWTVVELLIAAGIAGVIMAAVVCSWVFTARSFQAMGNYADLDNDSRAALDTMSREIREARVLGYYNTNSLLFTNMDGAFFGYMYDKPTKRLYRLSGKPGDSRYKVMLTGCDFFAFRIWLRNPTNGFWFPYSATNQQNLTKLVDINWRCSRQVIDKYNTESVQTAKIVLRN